MYHDENFDQWLGLLIRNFKNDQSYRPLSVRSPYGVHGCAYGNDDVDGGGEYVTIGFSLPNGIFAEIEDGTYGSLQGFRIYL